MNIEIDFYMGTATFFVDMVAAADKATYKGQFKVKCILNPLEYINSDALYRELLGKTNPQYASEYVSQLAYALSQLKYRIIKSPSWFKNNSTGVDGSNVDDKILLQIFEKTIQAEEDYRKGIEERYNSAKEEVKKAIDTGELSDGNKQEEQEDKEED